ncbi:MAG TPA: FAD-dependent oxidoreductase [Thermodesulfobacteriota bacterium]|nr:FAD-dependent oxidoreductase [Thermodesulfobacteriota bacterium]
MNKALVVGAGVIGLTSGIRLLEEGFQVRIIAASLPPETTSNVAPAYWYPYRVFPEGRVLAWATVSYKTYTALRSVPGTGIDAFELLKLFDRPAEEPFWKPAVKSYRHARPDELPPGYIDGFVVEVPRIETPVYMSYLVERFKRSGGRMEKLETELDSLDGLAADGEILVNCTGLGSRKLCGDENVYPIRGQLVRTSNPGLKKCLSDESGPLALSYIVPRYGDCILGGTAEENNWSLDVNPETAAGILRKCAILEPRIKDAEVLGHGVGLRPGRTEVCLEKGVTPGGRPVIHNYGHGGGGFTLSWGCAEEVVEIARGF